MNVIFFLHRSHDAHTRTFSWMRQTGEKCAHLRAGRLLQASCDRGVRDGATRRRGEQEVSDLAG